jgi:squamous cell carcinoma antigen recognized by T-cells 3
LKCGQIKTIRITTSLHSAFAILEFEHKNDALAALTKDQKTLGEHTITVGHQKDTILYVSNFPPSADENYLRQLFEKVSAHA